MEYSPCFNRTILAQDRQRILGRTPGVDDKGFVQLACCENMGSETCTLPLHFSHTAAIETIVIQPSFADCQYFGQ